MKKKLFGMFGAFCLVFMLAACSKNDASEETISSLKAENEKLKSGESTQESEVQESESSEDLYFNYLNEEVRLSNGEKETAMIKITQASTNQSVFPEHMINLDNYDTNKMVAVTIEYTNVAIPSPFLVLASYFQAFGKDGKALVQVDQQNGQDAVTEGRTGVTQLFWELPVNGNDFNQMEIDFVIDKKIATFILDVSH